MAFTQNSLLDPDDFAKQAVDRGVRLRVEQLAELHRVHALEPLLRILTRPSPDAGVVDVADSAQGLYHQVGTPLAHSIEAAGLRQLVDPGGRPYRSWESGIRVAGFGFVRTYPAAFYSPYQLLGIRTYEGLARQMEVSRVGEFGLRFRLPAPELSSEERDVLGGSRRLATLLHALDMHYLPRIILTVSYPDEWERTEPQFDVSSRLAQFGLTSEQLASTANNLLFQAHSIDPLGDWYELVRQAHPSTWSRLKGDARLAMDYRIAAEILLRALDDLGRTDLSTPPERTGRMVRVDLDDRLRPDPDKLEKSLTDRGLNSAPALLLVLEGTTEMVLMPDVLAELLGQPVPQSLIEIVDMKGIDRYLDLLVRREVAPRLGESQGNFVWLARPPTRMFIAVDPERRYATKQMCEQERSKLVTRIYEALDPAYQTASSRKEVDYLVEITTWGKYPWEFANFTNAELTAGITSLVSLPTGLTRNGVIAALQAERSALGRSPNVDRVCHTWPQRFTKRQLALALQPRLLAKVRVDIGRRERGERVRTPATRVALRALEIALTTHRRNVVLPI